MLRSYLLTCTYKSTGVFLQRCLANGGQFSSPSGPRNPQDCVGQFARPPPHMPLQHNKRKTPSVTLCPGQFFVGVTKSSGTQKSETRSIISHRCATQMQVKTATTAYSRTLCTLHRNLTSNVRPVPVYEYCRQQCPAHCTPSSETTSQIGSRAFTRMSCSHRP